LRFVCANGRGRGERPPRRDSGGWHLPRPHFEILEHTADAGIVARGSTLAETFAHAAEGMYSLMVNIEGVREADVREITASGDDVERLLTNWLLELLFVTETERLVFHRFDVEIQGDTLHARAYGEPVDSGRHEVGGMVKGVTRHMIEVAPDDGGFRARVLFDL
jgi:SHS2 domain-containing protein